MAKRVEKGIGINSFNKTMKDSVRDFFKYGYMSVKDMGKDGKEEKTVEKNYKLLIDILNNTWTRNEKKIILKKDSQSYEENPFHKLYRYCNLGRTENFLNILIALSKYFEIKGVAGEKKLEPIKKYSNSSAKDAIDNPNYEAEMGERWKKAFEFVKREYEERYYDSDEELLDFIENISGKSRCLSSKYLKAFNGGDVLENDLNEINDSCTRTIRDCANIYRRLGVLEMKKVGRKKVWKLSDFTMDSLLKAAENSYQEKNHQSEKKFNRNVFETHVRDALQFFSRAEVFGEIGTLLMERMKGRAGAEPYNQTPILYFKHDYFVHAVNDYNIIDFIWVWEENKKSRKKKYICKIEYYKNEKSNSSTELFLIPMEIRINDKDGREYVAGYNPKNRSYIFIRLDFIEKIEIFVCDKKEDLETWNRDIKYVEKLLESSWGESYREEEIRDDILDKNQKHLEVLFLYNPGKEEYIWGRIDREKRNGTAEKFEDRREIKFCTDIVDLEEWYPWMRSLYTRVKQIKINEIDKTELLYKEVSAMKSYIDDKNNRPSKKEYRISDENETNSEPQTSDKAKRKKVPHEMLFNPYIGIIHQIAGEILIECLKDPEIEVEEILKRKLDEYGTNEEGKMYFWENEVKETIETIIIQIEKIKYRFHIDPAANFMYNVLPLTLGEMRWVRSILDNPRIHLFLEDEEIDCLKNVFPETIEPFPFQDVIKHYERYEKQINLRCYERKSEARKHMRKLLDAIHNKRKIMVDYPPVYFGDQSKVKKVCLIPVRAEYSKRDDGFRFICLESKESNGKEDRTYTLNLERIKDVEVTEESVDNFSEVVHTVNDQMEKEKRTVTIGFYYDEILTDRILTEFSPWKKECVSENEWYTVTITYPDSEILDITIRLLEYGDYVCILGETEPEGRLYQNIPQNKNPEMRYIKDEFAKRLGNQLEIWKEREQQQERENELDERDR
ncbi:MAG: WYL domain-containing protein [Lachnospiraceae bacterium]